LVKPLLEEALWMDEKASGEDDSMTIDRKKSLSDLLTATGEAAREG